MPNVLLYYFLFLASLSCTYSPISHHPYVSSPSHTIFKLRNACSHYNISGWSSFFLPSISLEIPGASHHHFLFPFLPPLRSSIKLLHLCIFPNSFCPPAPHASSCPLLFPRFHRAVHRDLLQTAVKANQKRQPKTGEEQKAEPQARRQRSEGRCDQLGSGAARSQKDAEGLPWKNRKGRRK